MTKFIVMLFAAALLAGGCRNAAAPGACPKCGSGETVPIVYGLPGPGALARAEKGEFILGGCIRMPENRGCKACRNQFRFEPECPACGSTRTAPVVYGDPTNELRKRAEGGEFILGGCELMPENRGCRNCDYRFKADSAD